MRLRIYRQSINDIGNLQLGTLYEAFYIQCNREKLKDTSYLIEQFLAVKFFLAQMLII